MKKVISITRRDREFIMKAFGVTSQMVSYALNWNPVQGSSELAKKIRKLAMERGGFVVVCAPASEVVHDAEGVMRQYFDNGWMWEGDKKTGVLTVLNQKGEPVERIENATIRDIEAVQQSVAVVEQRA